MNTVYLGQQVGAPVIYLHLPLNGLQQEYIQWRVNEQEKCVLVTTVTTTYHINICTACFKFIASVDIVKKQIPLIIGQKLQKLYSGSMKKVDTEIQRYFSMIFFYALHWLI